MMSLFYGYMPPKMQDQTIVTQASPGTGTKYTLLDTTKNVRVITAVVRCTWTVQPNPLELHGTIDGQTFRWYSAAPVSNTWYDAVWDSEQDIANQGFVVVGSNAPHTRAFLLEAQSVKIEMEVTGGTVSEVKGKVIYATW